MPYDDKAAMDADNRKMNSLLSSPLTQDLQMTEAMSFFDRVHVQLGDAHAVFSLYDGFRQLSPLPAGWAEARDPETGAAVYRRLDTGEVAVPRRAPRRAARARARAARARASPPGHGHTRG